jgi:hypothetical protein
VARKPEPVHELLVMLKRRGLEPLRWSTPKDLFLSEENPHRQKFFERLKNYSFRIVLRDIIKHQEGFLPQDLTRFCSLRKVSNHLAFLSKLKIITFRKKKYYLTGKPLRSFGDTLEWFIARLFEQEFDAQVLWGLCFKNSLSGGDYDVIARIDGELAYIEVKSSPPKHIEQRDAQAFLKRIEALLPHLAFFFVDTELRMKDKIVPLFQDELHSRYGQVASRNYPVTRLRDELFHIHHQIFIVNSKRDIIPNFRDCFRDYWRSQIKL